MFLHAHPRDPLPLPPEKISPSNLHALLLLFPRLAEVESETLEQHGVGQYDVLETETSYYKGPIEFYG